MKQPYKKRTIVISLYKRHNEMLTTLNTQIFKFVFSYNSLFKTSPESMTMKNKIFNSTS